MATCRVVPCENDGCTCEKLAMSSLDWYKKPICPECVRERHLKKKKRCGIEGCDAFVMGEKDYLSPAENMITKEYCKYCYRKGYGGKPNIEAVRDFHESCREKREAWESEQARIIALKGDKVLCPDCGPTNEDCPHGDRGKFYATDTSYKPSGWWSVE